MERHTPTITEKLRLPVRRVKDFNKFNVWKLKPHVGGCHSGSDAPSRTLLREVHAAGGTIAGGKSWDNPLQSQGET